MTKTELQDALAAKAGMNKAEAGRAVEAILDVITEALVNGEKVAITGFGNFEVKDRAARQGRNPKTGETIQIAASKAPTFKAGSKLKEAVNK